MKNSINQSNQSRIPTENTAWDFSFVAKCSTRMFVLKIVAVDVNVRLCNQNNLSILKKNEITPSRWNHIENTPSRWNHNEMLEITMKCLKSQWNAWNHIDGLEITSTKARAGFVELGDRIPTMALRNNHATNIRWQWLGYSMPRLKDGRMDECNSTIRRIFFIAIHHSSKSDRIAKTLPQCYSMVFDRCWRFRIVQKGWGSELLVH